MCQLCARLTSTLGSYKGDGRCSSWGRCQLYYIYYRRESASHPGSDQISMGYQCLWVIQHQWVCARQRYISEQCHEPGYKPAGHRPEETAVGRGWTTGVPSNNRKTHATSKSMQSSRQTDHGYCPGRIFRQVSVTSCKPEDLILTLQKHVSSQEKNTDTIKHLALCQTQI